MAKETKEQKPAKAQETTVDNVVEQLRAKNLQSSTSVQAALEKMQKETEEKKRDEAIRAIKKFEYKNFRALLELRKRRAEEKATKEYLAGSKQILDDYLAEKLTRVEADKKSEEIEEAKRKAFSEAEKDFSNQCRELKDAYPGYWCYEWDCRW